MVWRIWVFLSGAPLGVLLLWSVMPEADRPAIYIAAFLAGAFLVGIASAFVRQRQARDSGGVGHALHAASAGWIAWPAVAAVRLDIGPGAWPFAGVALAWLALAFWRQGRAHGPSPSPLRHVARLMGELALGWLVALVIGGIWAATDGGRVEPDAELQALAWSIDAGVALAPAHACLPRAAQWAVLSESGARPRLSADARRVWYEGRGDDGRAQVFALDRASGAAECFTCEEPGNNRRPAPHPTRAAVLFDTDRHATWRHPGNTEVMAIDARERSGPRPRSARLTYSHGRDEHAFHDPTGGGLVWLHTERGRASVRRAVIGTGHGGIALTGEQDLMRAGAGWVIPLAWAPDARALVAARGHGLGPRTGELLDVASGERRSLGAGLTAGSSVGFSADGSVMAVAETSTIRAVALLPASLGFFLERLPSLAAGARARLTAGTTIRLGDPRGTLTPLVLAADLAGWGAPTGVSLAADARTLVLGQRDEQGRERLLELVLDCADPAESGASGHGAMLPADVDRGNQ